MHKIFILLDWPVDIKSNSKLSIVFNFESLLKKKKKKFPVLGGQRRLCFLFYFSPLHVIDELAKASTWFVPLTFPCWLGSMLCHVHVNWSAVDFSLFQTFILFDLVVVDFDLEQFQSHVNECN